MFKCDTPELPTKSCLDADRTLLPYGARLAMIGCMPPDLPNMSEYDDDYARRTASGVVKLFERFCSHRGQLDEDLLQSLLLKVRVVCLDGALLVLKTAETLRISRMPNIVLIVRDPAHVIRTSTANPLLHTSSKSSTPDCSRASSGLERLHELPNLARPARRLSYPSSNISNHVVTYIKLQKRALSMVPWLSRAERETREKTRKTTELRVWANRCVPRRRSVVPCGGVGRGRGWTRLRGGWAIEKSRRSYHAVAPRLPCSCHDVATRCKMM